MRIIKGTDVIPVEFPVFMIFGQPGIGKSSLGYSCGEPLTLDFDRGAHRAANRRDTLIIDGWEDVIELMDSKDTLAPYSTIVTDTVGRCLDVMTAHMAKVDPKKAPGGNPTLQGWGQLKNNFRTWVAAMRGLGKDVLLIAHDKEDKDGDMRVVRPDIAGGSYGEVMKVADFVGYYYMSGKDRVLDFNPTDRWIGKNPAGWAPFKVPPVGKAQSFMADLFDRGREALGQLSEESARIMGEVEDWRTKIANTTSAKDCNALIPEIKKLSAIVQPQVSKILMDHAAEQRIPFDRAKKHFTETPEQEPAAAGSLI